MRRRRGHSFYFLFHSTCFRQFTTSLPCSHTTHMKGCHGAIYPTVCFCRGRWEGYSSGRIQGGGLKLHKGARKESRRQPTTQISRARVFVLRARVMLRTPSYSTAPCQAAQLPCRLKTRSVEVPNCGARDSAPSEVDKTRVGWDFSVDVLDKLGARGCQSSRTGDSARLHNEVVVHAVLVGQENSALVEMAQQN